VRSGLGAVVAVLETSFEPIAHGRQQQADLELHRQGIVIDGRRRHGCVSASGVREAGYDTRMKKAVLLSEMLHSHTSSSVCPAYRRNRRVNEEIGQLESWLGGLVGIRNHVLEWVA
jgi:hypothetical protein